MDGTSKKIEHVPFSPPAIGDDEINGVLDTLRSDWLSTGPKTNRFQAAFAEFVGAQSALALNSCTAALHLALKALDIGCGDEVITTTLTFVSTVNVIEHVGAKPILVDVEYDTLNIDPRAVEAAITSKTKAIIVVHFAGHPVDMSAINRIAERHGLAVIEDAAHALPAAYQGQMIGSGGNFTAFSFYATKNLTTAEGGMLTGAPDLVDRAKSFSLHGMSRNAWNRYGTEGSWFYDVLVPGFKYNMSDLQAAIGLAQLSRLEQMQQKRRMIFNAYDEAFCGSDSLEIPTRRSDIDHALHLYVLRLRDQTTAEARNALIEDLKERGIGVSVHFIPVHLHSYYREKYGYRSEDFPVAYSNYQRMLSLPLSPALNNSQICRVIGTVCDLVPQVKRLAG